MSLYKVLHIFIVKSFNLRFIYFYIYTCLFLFVKKKYEKEKHFITVITTIGIVLGTYEEKIVIILTYK